MLTSQKEMYSLEEGIHYLNCAYMSPLLKTVEEAGIEGVRRKARPYHITPSDFFSEVKLLKESFARLINADGAHRIAIVPSVSYGMASVARNVKGGKGDNIVIIEEQFPSNVYAWRERATELGMEVRTVNAPGQWDERGRNWNQRILEAIDSHTQMVALAHVHWADGTLFQLKSIKEALKSSGGWLVVDGTQSVGALPIDVKEMGIDALVCAGYKWLMGPYSMGLAYYDSVFDEGTPIEHSWMNRAGSEDFAQLVRYTDKIQEGAGRYSVGESSNFILVPMQLAALQQIHSWGVDTIQEYAKNLFAPFENRFRESGFFLDEPAFRSAHLLGLRKKGLDVISLPQKLKEAGIFVSVRGNAIRVSISVFNEAEDLERLWYSLKD